jgi:hypothetical protein
MNLKVVLVLGALLCLTASQEVRGRDKRTIGALFGHFSGIFGSNPAPPPRPTTTTPKPQPVFSLNSLFQGLDFFKQIPQLSQPPKFQQQQQQQPAPPPPPSPPAQLPIPADPPMAPSQPPSPGPSKIPLPLGPVEHEQPPAAPQPEPQQTPQPEPPMPPMAPSPVPEQPEPTPDTAAEASPSPPNVDVTINLSSTAESLPPTTSGSAQPKNGGSAEGSFESSPLDSFEQSKDFSFGQDFGSFPQKSFAYQTFPQANFQYNFPTKFSSYDFQPAPLHQEYHQQYIDFVPSAPYVPAKVSYNTLPTTYNHFGPSMAKSSVKMPHATYEHITYHDNSGEFNGGYHNHY